MKFSSSGGNNHSFSSGNAHNSTPASGSGMRSTQQRTSSAPRSQPQRSQPQRSTSRQYTQPQHHYQAPPPPRQQNNNSSVLKQVGAGLLGAYVGKKLNENNTTRRQSYDNSPYYPSDSCKSPVRTHSTNRLGFLKGIVIAAILVGLAYLIIAMIVPMFQKKETQSIQNAAVSTTHIATPADDYYLYNNTLLEAYDVPFTNDSSKLSLKIKAYHSSNATTALDMRNSHFYDVVQLIREQGANPSNGVYEIEYIGVGDSEDNSWYTDIIYFVLDENIILDILDGYINYDNLYEYCLDLWLHEYLQ